MSVPDAAAMGETRASTRRMASGMWAGGLRVDRLADMNSFHRRALVSFALLPAFIVARQVRAQAAAPVLLFKVGSPRDGVGVGIGVTLMLGSSLLQPRHGGGVGTEAPELGAGATPPVQRLAAMLAEKGQLTLWQYASQHGEGGALVQAPLRQIVVFRNELLRIEPYSTPLAIKPPGAAK